MKRIIGTIMVALSFLWTVAPAQAQVQFGIVGGLNVSKLSIDDLPGNVSSDNRCGWYLGPKVEFTLPIIGLGVDAALEYSQRRINGSTAAATVGTTSVAEVSSSTNYNSIEIPINLRYSVGLSGLASVYLATGPQFGFNVGSKNWAWNDVYKYKLEDSNFTWNIGAGVKLLKKLEVGVGYNFALSKFAKSNIPLISGTQFKESEFKTNSWQIQVAYLF